MRACPSGLWRRITPTGAETVIRSLREMKHTANTVGQKEERVNLDQGIIQLSVCTALQGSIHFFTDNRKEGTVNPAQAIGNS